MREMVGTAPCRVRIVKASKETYWYASHIGEEFDTDLAGQGRDYVLWEDYASNAIMWRHIQHEDCEKIETKPQTTNQ